MLADVHAHFIDAVRKGRGERLDPNPEIFSGLFWSGKQARELGLVDEFGSADTIAREVVGAAKIIDYTARLNFVDRLARQIGASIGNVVFSKLLQIQ